ncbi:hypothetical protein GF373_11980 [bacterium]|nr:hypothetical protein [bacterium]
MNTNTKPSPSSGQNHISQYVFLGLKWNHLILILPILVLAFVLLSNPNGFTSIDSFYHYTLAEELPGPHEFRWLPKTIYQEGFFDRHYLFHLALYPFVQLFHLHGAHLFVLLIDIALAFCVYYFFRYLNIPTPLLWSLFFFFSSPLFLVRLSQLRPIGLSICLWIGVYYTLFTNKKWGLFALLAVYGYSYSSYFSLLLIPFVFYLIRAERIENKNIFLFLQCGFILLLVSFINPYFPYSVLNLAEYALAKTEGESFKILMASEWRSIDSWHLITLFWPLWTVMIGFFLCYRNIKIQWNETLTVFFLISLICFILSCKSIRFIDYWIPNLCIFLALFHKNIIESTSPEKEVFSFKLFLCLLVGAAALITSLNYSHSMANRYRDTRTLKQAAMWLKNNVKENEIIVNMTQDSFPELLFHNRQNTYLTGMDFKYLSRQSPSLAHDYIQLKTGINQNPADFVKRHNLGSYLFVDKRYSKGLRFDQIPKTYRVYEDRAAVIYKIELTP